MAVALISLPAMRAMRAARGSIHHRATVRATLAEAKQHYGIPVEQRVKVEIDERDKSNFGVLIRKCTGQPFQVMANLVPTYDFNTAFGKLPAKEAVLILKAVAPTLDGSRAVTSTASTFKPTFGDTWADANNVYVPVGPTVWAVPIEDAMAILAMSSEPVYHDMDPLGYGGCVVMGDDLLVA